MIPTAEEFLNEMKYVTYSAEEKLITFAKLHVDAALKKATENVKMRDVDIGGGLCISYKGINKDSILDAYPLENIK